MHLLHSRRHRGRGIASGISHHLTLMTRLLDSPVESWLDIGPGTGVEWFLLAPDNVLDVVVLVEELLELGVGEWVHLLDAEDGNVGDFLGGAGLVEGGVDLAGTDDEAAAGGWGGDAGGGLGDDPLEVRVAGEFGEVGAGEWVAEEGLGEEEDEC